MNMGKSYSELAKEMSLGKRFGDAFTQIGFTDETVAKALGVEISKVQNFIDETEDLTVREFEEWCRALNLNLLVDNTEANFF